MQDNYQLQAKHAKECFLKYSQQELIENHHLKADETYLYTALFGVPYRINRSTGDMDCYKKDVWTDANSHGEVMTILDLLCDSQETRHPANRFKGMQAFGHQFHQNLGEQNPQAALFENCPEKLGKACSLLGGVPFESGDVAYTIPVFEDLKMVLQFWLGDEEFAPRLRFLWDENALQYLKYETMYYAVDVLISRIKELI